MEEWEEEEEEENEGEEQMTTTEPYSQGLLGVRLSLLPYCTAESVVKPDTWASADPC